jgi:MoxR-like ATPase
VSAASGQSAASAASGQSAVSAAPAFERAAASLDEVRRELHRVIVGQERMLDRVMSALLADGHCLLEGVPGLGKTLTLATLARILGGSFSRIQFTPDLLPADIVGTRVYRASTEAFDVETGPVLANFVLADEVNRAPAKVQAAMLEVMAERQVTIGDRTLPAPRPFLVMATQNPIESEGVYPLPEAQRDRFLMRVPLDYPSAAEEREIVRRMGVTADTARRVLDPAGVAELQRVAAAVFVDEPVVDYALRLVHATRRPGLHGLSRLEGMIAYGASPRASLALVACARSLALLRGRAHATSQDVYDVAYDVLNHRLILSYEAIADGLGVDDVLVELLTSVPAPAGAAG